MEIPSKCKKLRYFSNSQSLYSLFSHSPHPFLSPKTLVSPKPSPNFFFHSDHFNTKPTANSLYPLISSTGSSSFFAASHPLPQSSQDLHRYRYNSNEQRRQISNVGLLKPYSNRCFSGSTENVKVGKMVIDGIRANATPKQVSEMIGIIMSNDNDLESKLDSMNVSLSIASITEIFRVLNFKRVSALRFFAWIRRSKPDLYGNSDICSLAVDNCGWLDDYKTMLFIMNDFSMKGICLTEKAFGFLPVLVSNKDLIMLSVRRVVEVLNEAGGSCRTSGVHSLIKMLCAFGSFKMAKFVIEITEKKASYYYILIREKCRRCDFEGAMEMLDEMRRVGCGPIVNAYNYLLSSLCRSDKTAEACQAFEEMPERDCLPDALTFEIFICYWCRLGKFNLASEFLDRMVSNGLEPRSSTHAAFIKGYFNSMRYEEAYKYLVESVVKYKCSCNSTYSLLASLHQKKGNVVVARNIFVEMIKKGLRPNFAVHMRVLKHLKKSGREDLASDLNSRFSCSSLQLSTETV